MVNQFKENMPERFVSKVDFSEGNSCWNWTAWKTRDGYGGYFHEGRDQVAHRVCFKLHYETEIPDGNVIMHSCDNPGCVNPDHLIMGTQSDNIIDKVRKGRGFDNKGENHPLSKLTADQVVEMRKLYATGDYSLKQLGQKFGVWISHVSNIVNRKRWKHI